ncbi:hypothetical protein K469DRAFT_598139 [Zopfia rhizophila CBS 207.26]|uniref:Zn(2)-C6 fungal-type domain-containing protein n=1 Tax=Zopfia rhizophila CBS 207.26 TaxID=1314779 RepID=A0A6A6DKD7_9PEZI|nr:hypothetical protein K469DRAFT_598139 [Zopfia rhizophila CBS 207.26]
MPPERNRNTNFPGRQKSCTECVKSKRRCDLQQPCCLRCGRQKLICSYPSRPVVDDTPSTQDDSPMSDGIADNGTFPFDIPTLPNHQDTELLDFDFNVGIESIDVLNDLLNNTEPEELALPLVRSNYAPGKQSSASHITSFAYSRINYPIEQMKLALAVMVSENQTPWSHPLLYEDEMPRFLQDAHATCALYIAQNETNAIFVTRHITDRVNELLEMATPTKPLEILARAHALILYQSMHVFGGDIRHNSQVDSTLQHLEASGYAIHNLLQGKTDPPTSPLPLYPSTAARQAWKAFILREACRRTLLIAFQFISMCHLLRGRQSYCSNHEALASHVTYSAHLWKASSAFEFAVAWNEKRHFLVKDLDFTEVLETAQPEDIDVFGRMLLVATMGIDDVKGWFHARGGTF